MLEEANNIRMYSWAALFVSLSAIYAYRLCSQNKVSLYVYFVIFSLLAAYLHYFATFTIVLINIILLINQIKNKEVTKIKRYLISGVIETLLFIPGIIIFFYQVTNVTQGYWIEMHYPWILINTVFFYFNLAKGSRILNIMIVLVGILIGICSIKVLYKNRKDKNAKLAMIAILIYTIIIVVSLMVSIVKPIFVPRYSFPMVALVIFALSYVLANIENQKIYSVMMLCLIFISIANIGKFFIKIYARENQEVFQIVEENLKDTDILLYNNTDFASIYANRFSTHKNIVYHLGANWNLKKVLEVDGVELIENLENVNLNNRIWLIEDEERLLTKAMEVEKDNIILQKECFYPYINCSVYITLLDNQEL